MADGSLYVVRDDQDLTAEWLNTLLGDIHTRIRTIEAIKSELSLAISELAAVGLQRIDAVVSPLIQQAQEDVAAVQANLVEVAQQIADILAGAIPAASVVESATRVFVTPAQRTAIGQIAGLVDALPTKVPSANAILSGLLAITGAAKLTAFVTLAALTADANDLTPADFALATRVKVSANAVRSITGLVAAEDGRVVLLENTGANDINLKAESTSSAAGNRFAFHSDAILPKNGGVVTLIYDGALARWLLAGGGKIADLQIGDLLETAANPGARFLQTNGSLYLNSAYPALRAVLGPYTNPMVSRLTASSGSPQLFFINNLWITWISVGGVLQLQSSPDLLTWTVRVANWALSVPTGLAYGAGLYVATVGGAIQTSPDLATWTNRALPSGFTGATCVARSSTRFVIAGPRTSGYGAIYSADGIAWTLSATAITQQTQSIAWNTTGGRWAIACNTGRIWRSTDDGFTWADMGAVAGTGNLHKIAAAGGNFVALSISPSAIVYSADAQTWSTASGVTLSGSPLALSHDGLGWTFSLDTSTLLYSTNLASWTVEARAAALGIANAVYRTGQTINDATVLAVPGGVYSGLDVSLTQFQVPTIAGRAANTQAYIKAL